MLVAGVDEVGRGPLAGAVIAAAVIIEEYIPGIKDSKQLTPIKRANLAQKIQDASICYAYGRAEVEEVDALNIHHATLLAMQRAIIGLAIQPEKILIDGIFAPRTAIPCYVLPKGDTYIYEISCASILAKVYRDAEMIQMEQQFPGYGFAQHKGYSTEAHRTALNALGPCIIHRKTFTECYQIKSDVS